MRILIRLFGICIFHKSRRGGIKQIIIASKKINIGKLLIAHIAVCRPQAHSPLRLQFGR